MPGRISLERLRLNLIKHKMPWRDSEDNPVPETISLASRCLQYCRENRLDSPISADPSAPICVHELGTRAYGFWAADPAAIKFWETHPPHETNDDDEEEKEPESPFKYPGTLAFEVASI